MKFRAELLLGLGAFVSLFFLLEICQAQEASDHRKMAGEAFRRSFNLGESVPLHVVHRPDLDEALSLTLRVGSQSLVVPRVAFYEVSVGTFGFRGEEIQSETLQLDGEPEGLIAYGPGEKQFLLRGFEGAANDFNELASSIRFSIQDSEGALGILDLYFKLVRDPANVLADDMQLESIALADFRLSCRKEPKDCVPEVAKGHPDQLLAPPKTSTSATAR
ncbi:MAG: hypothetical protein ACRD5G_01990 [Candidatus Acidiferrales bacterium]